jgi:hypothetical protein
LLLLFLKTQNKINTWEREATNAPAPQCPHLPSVQLLLELLKCDNLEPKWQAVRILAQCCTLDGLCAKLGEAQVRAKGAPSECNTAGVAVKCGLFAAPAGRKKDSCGKYNFYKKN